MLDVNNAGTHHAKDESLFKWNGESFFSRKQVSA